MKELFIYEYYLLGWGCHGMGETEEKKGGVKEAVLVVLGGLVG